MSVYLEQFGIWVTDEEATAIAALPPAATPPTIPTTGQTLTGTSYSRESGKAIVAGVLRAAGLDASSPSFATYINDLLTSTTTQEDLANRLQADVYDPATVPGQEVKRRYPAIFTRQQEGKPPISVGDYQRLVPEYTALLNATGVTSYVQPDELIDRWIAGDTSVGEAQNRLETVVQTVYNEPVEVRAELQRLFGVGDSFGAAVAYYLNGDKALPDIQRQLRQAELSGAAIRSGFGLLTADEATRLQQVGVTAEQAQAGFGQLAQSQELFGQLPGDVDPAFGREQQIGALAGDAAAQAEVDRRGRARKNVFGSNAGFSGGQRGVGGLGSAAS